MDDYSEKRLDRIEAKIDALAEAVNSMKVNAAGCSAHFEEHDRQLESLECASEKKRESTGTIVGIATGITALLAFFGELLYNVFTASKN